MGINVARNICVTTAVSSIICSVIGMPDHTAVQYIHHHGSQHRTQRFSAGVIGGFGYLPEPSLGVCSSEWWKTWHGGSSAVYKDIVSFVLLIIFLLVHPSGFLARRRKGVREDEES